MNLVDSNCITPCFNGEYEFLGSIFFCFQHLFFDSLLFFFILIDASFNFQFLMLCFVLSHV